MSKQTKALKALTARVEAIEAILRDLAARNYVAADILRENVKWRIDGLREVRGNDGVLLGTINLHEGAQRRSAGRKR